MPFPRSGRPDRGRHPRSGPSDHQNQSSDADTRFRSSVPVSGSTVCDGPLDDAAGRCHSPDDHPDAQRATGRAAEPGRRRCPRPLAVRPRQVNPGDGWRSSTGFGRSHERHRPEPPSNPRSSGSHQPDATCGVSSLRSRPSEPAGSKRSGAPHQQSADPTDPRSNSPTPYPTTYERGVTRNLDQAEFRATRKATPSPSPSAKNSSSAKASRSSPGRARKPPDPPPTSLRLAVASRPRGANRSIKSRSSRGSRYMWHTTRSIGSPGGKPSSRSQTSNRDRSKTSQPRASSRARPTATGETSTPSTFRPRRASQTDSSPRPEAISRALPSIGNRFSIEANTDGGPGSPEAGPASACRWSHRRRSVSLTAGTIWPWRLPIPYP